jgi:D-alanine-D-alanine ligase
MSKKIAVLMGGPSLERDVSLKSGERVTAALSRSGYRVVPLDVTSDLVDRLRSEKPDAVYIALHGRFGEDGTVQELLDFLDVPYTGPGVLANTLAWDKAISKRLFVREEIPTPEWVTLTSDAFKQMGAAAALDHITAAVGDFPLAVKPAKQGSALGLAKVEEADALPEALLAALSYDDKAIVERWVEGVELAVSVLDGKDGPEVLPSVEIEAKSGLFDFTAMYTAGETEYFVPARVADDVGAEIDRLAKAVHLVVGCRDVSRVDMVVGDDDVPYVLECNTSPGMTETSLLPMAAEHAGLGFDDVVDRLARSALARGGT